MRFLFTIIVPELPEVETTKNGLLSLIGKRVTATTVHFPRLRYPIPAEVKSLSGEILQDIVRRGKYLIFMFAHHHLIIHLGMSGKIRLESAHNPVQKHDHFELIFGDNALRLNDARRFGCVLLASDYTQHPLITHLGVEPLSKDFTAQYLWEKSQQKKSHIKSYIMDSRVVVGVGNIYAAESLFLAGIHPERRACSVSFVEYEKLTDCIKEVLQNAIDSGGTTLQDFAGVGGELGYFVQELQVYGREDKSCIVCGEIIQRIVQNQRSTFFCPHCQK